MSQMLKLTTQVESFKKDLTVDDSSTDPPIFKLVSRSISRIVTYFWGLPRNPYL